MAELKKKIGKIVEDLEKNIKDKEDLEYAKNQIYNVSMLFLDELDKVAELNLGKLNEMLNREKELTKRMAEMEKAIKEIEEEMYISGECDFEIQCPYCSTEFVEDFTNGVKHEVRCPECDNIIELDWHEDEECGCGCEECDGECIDEEESNDEEDDM